MSKILTPLFPLCLIVMLSVLAVFVAAEWGGLALWDDSFMFARYGQHLLTDRAIVWNAAGAPTYGLTSSAYLFVLRPLFFLFPNSPALALWMGSAGCGILFIVALFAFLRSGISCDSDLERWTLYLFAGLVLGGASPELAVHFSSGMDTSFSMLWICCVLIVLEGGTSRRSLFFEIIYGIFVGLTFCVRPDALLLLTPILILRKADCARRILCLASFSAVLAMQLLIGKLYFNSWLPYPFFVKSGGNYDAGFYEFYHGATQYYAILFLSCIPWIILVLLAQSVVDWRSFTRRQIVMLGSCAAFFCYQIFFVTPIMGEHSRFFFPTLPLLCFSAAEAVLMLLRRIRKKLEHVPALASRSYFSLMLVTIALSAVLKPTDLRLAYSKAFSVQGPIWELSDIYRSRYSKTWAKLDAVSTLPSDLVIASTEVGLLGLMNVDKKIVDMTGLHDANFLHGFKTKLLWDSHPDLIYMPFPHYVSMTQAIEQDPYFQEEYRYYTASELDARFGVGLRRGGKYFNQLEEIFGRTENSHP